MNTLYNFLGSLTSTVNSNTVNQFTYQYSTFDNRINATTDLDLLIFPDGIAVGRNGNVPQQTIQKKHQFRDDLTWNRGNHGFKFGGDFTYVPTLGGLFAFNSAPEYDFNFTIEEIVSDPVSFPQGFRTPGVVGAIFLSGGDPSFNLRDGAKQFAFYVQDDWKIKPNFTLNFGVRYDVDYGFVDSAHAADNRAFRALQIIGSPFARKVVEDDKNNFSPRIGFAWDPFSDGKTIVRAGYGLYYDQPLVGIFEQNSFVNPPFNSRSVFTGAAVTLSNPGGGALGALPIRNLIANAPDFTTPEIQQWSLGVQRELFRNAVLDVSYVGTKGDHLIRQRNINLPLPADVLRVGTGNRNTIRPFLGYGTINYRETSAISRYHGLLSSFVYRFGNGFSITSAYTFSKTLTDATNDRDGIDDPQNPFDIRRFEYAEARTSRPHVFSASYVYEIPYFTNDDNTALRLLLGGWQISGITNFASGQPLPRVFNATGDEIRGGRAELVGDPLGGVTGTADMSGLPFFFNPDAFALPADGTFGDSFRAFGRKPGQNQTNLSAVKNFYFNREKDFYLQFRAEGFNIFNHTQFLLSDTNSFSLSQPATLGRPTSTRLPREFQFGLKLYF